MKLEHLIKIFYYNSDTRIGRSVSQIGQSSSSDNQQQIGSLDLYLTWSNDDNSFIGNSTINFDEVKRYTNNRYYTMTELPLTRDN